MIKAGYKHIRTSYMSLKKFTGLPHTQCMHHLNFEAGRNHATNTLGKLSFVAFCLYLIGWYAGWAQLCLQGCNEKG